MNRKEMRDLFVGPIGTMPTPFDRNFEVDYGRMHELTQWWVANGMVNLKSCLKVAAAMGEGPMLRDDEWPLLVRIAVNAAKGKVPIVAGLHYKDTKRTIEDAKRAQDMGAMGIQVCPPIFNLPTQQDIYDYYAAISNAIDIGIIVYINHWMLGGSIDTDTILKMADLERVVSIKWSQPGTTLYEDMLKFKDIFGVIDNTASPIRCHKLGGIGYVQTTIWAYPAHDLKVWELCKQGEYEEAQAQYDRVGKRFHQFYERMGSKTGSGQARAMKGLMEAVGLPVGASRPPSKPLNKEEMAECRQMVEEWDWPQQKI